MRGGALAAPRPTARDQAATMLAALVDDPVVGVEARASGSGYLQWAIRDDESARASLTRAAADAKDADDRYLARVPSRVDRDAGRKTPPRRFRISTRRLPRGRIRSRRPSRSPRSTLQQGDAARAHDLAQSSLDKRPADVDPWRLILYGHYSRLPGLIAQLRTQVHP